MKEYIPNFNTLSTLIDRLSIENVKLSHFENALEHDSPAPAQVADLENKIGVQHKIIAELKAELTAMMKEIFLAGEYRYMKEERTFQ